MLFIARRYLFSRRSHSVINIIAGVSLVSVAVPVAAIIILLSIFNGFGVMVESMNESVDADLTIVAARGRYFDVEDLELEALRGVEGVEFLSLVRDQSMMLEREGREAVVTLRGVDDNYLSVVPIGESMRVGDFRVRLGDLDRLVIGNAMATKLGVRSNRQGYINIYSIKESRLSSMMPSANFVRDSAAVSGIYLLDLESESRYAYAPLRLMSRMMGDDKISSIVVRVADGSSIRGVRDRVQGVVGADYILQRREDLNPVLYDIIKYEKWGIIFISAMVMLLASFSLLGIVAMLIIEKREDMITLRAMGARWSDIRAIFFMQGMLISGVGTLLGLIVGVVVTLIQQIWGVVKLPMGGFVIDAYPVNLQVMDVVGVILMSLCVTAAINRIVTLEMIKNR